MKNVINDIEDDGPELLEQNYKIPSVQAPYRLSKRACNAHTRYNSISYTF